MFTIKEKYDYLSGNVTESSKARQILVTVDTKHKAGILRSNRRRNTYK